MKHPYRATNFMWILTERPYWSTNAAFHLCRAANNVESSMGLSSKLQHQNAVGHHGVNYLSKNSSHLDVGEYMHTKTIHFLVLTSPMTERWTTKNPAADIFHCHSPILRTTFRILLEIWGSDAQKLRTITSHKTMRNRLLWEWGFPQAAVTGNVPAWKWAYT